MIKNCFRFANFFINSYAFLYVLILSLLIYISTIFYYSGNDYIIMDISVCFFFFLICLYSLFYNCLFLLEIEQDEKKFYFQLECDKKKFYFQLECDKKKIEFDEKKSYFQLECDKKKLKLDEIKLQFDREKFEFDKKKFYMFNTEKGQKTSESVTEEKLNTDTKNNIKK